MNHFDAFPYKKFRTAAVCMTFVILTVALVACQKSEPETENAAAPGSKMMDKVSETTGEATKAAGEMVEETKDKAGEAYQKSTTTVKEVASQGEDAVETANDAVGGALKSVTLPKTE